MRRFGWVCALMLASAVASAQPTPTDVALAQSLFEEGTALMRHGKFSEACPKLAESQQLDPGGGTLINLAVCLEKDGKLASAYLAYHEALAVAERDGNKTREAIARDRIGVIAPMVSHVVITIAPDAQALEGLEVRFDTANVRRAAWGVAAPVDMGEHVVTASAPGRIEWRSVVLIDKPGSTIDIQVPSLVELPTQPRPTVAPAIMRTPIEAEHHGGTQRGAGWILVGTGGAAAVVGIVTASLAVARHSDARCTNGVCPTLDGVAAERDANTLAWAANVSFGAAIVSAGIGAVLLLTAPKIHRVMPALGPSYVGVSGRF